MLADDRNVDLGEDVRRHLEENQRRRDEDEQRHYQEGVRSPQRYFDDPH
jgi:hypothetical protein